MALLILTVLTSCKPVFKEDVGVVWFYRKKMCTWLHSKKSDLVLLTPIVPPLRDIPGPQNFNFQSYAWSWRGLRMKWNTSLRNYHLMYILSCPSQGGIWNPPNRLFQGSDQSFFTRSPRLSLTLLYVFLTNFLQPQKKNARTHVQI